MNDNVCVVCGRNPQQVNSVVAECSHVNCPNRKQLTAFGIGDDDIEFFTLTEHQEDLLDAYTPLTELFK